MRLVLLGCTTALILAGIAACGGGGDSAAPASPPAEATRTWAMGFSAVPPRATTAAVLQGIDLWSQRAEWAAIHEELPWTDLLGGILSPEQIFDRDKVQLVDYVRSKGLKLYFMADLTDGLSRAEESPQLRALGRSITEPAVQLAYRNYLLAVERKLHPEIIGLAAETNLIRAAALPAVYVALVQATNDAAADLRAAHSAATLSVSVQVETAWGSIGNTSYAGVEQDFTDFPFTQMLGLSSYPYFGFSQPEDIPANYYSRVLNGHTLPVMVVEGGWTSAAAGSIQSTPEKQARYITRHAQLLDSVAARGLIQLVFADIDLASFPPPFPANLPLFINIGLTDSDFNAKPALAAWDALHARRLIP